MEDNETTTTFTLPTMDVPRVPDVPEVTVSKDWIDAATANLVDDVTHCYIQPAISLFGLVGNLLSFIILFRERKKYNSNIILLALAVSDTLFLVFKNYRLIVCVARMVDTLIARNLAIRMTPHVTFIPVVLSRMTGMLTALIAVDRFVALTWPFKYKAWMTAKRVLICIVVSFLVPAVFHIPLFMRNGIFMRYNGFFKQVVPNVGLTKLYLEYKDFFDVWKNLVLNIGFYIIPLVVVIITSSINIYHLRRMSNADIRKETATGNASQRERKASLTLTCISVIYAVCSLPSFGFLLVRFINPEYDYHGSMKHSFTVTTKLAGILVVINSSVNFIIYCLVGRVFRDQFVEMLRCGRKKPAKIEEKIKSTPKEKKHSS